MSKHELQAALREVANLRKRILAVDKEREQLVVDRKEMKLAYVALESQLADEKGKLDIIARENAGEPDDELAVDYGGMGLESDPAVASTRELRKQLAEALRERDEARAEVDTLNWLLREKGYGQGEIDGMAADVAERDRLRQRIARVEGALKWIIAWAESVTKDWAVEDDCELSADLQMIHSCRAALRAEGGKV